MNNLRELLHNTSVPVVIFTNLKRDNICCVNGLQKQFNFTQNNRLYIQSCYEKQILQNNDMNYRKEAFNKITNLKIDNEHYQDEKFDNNKLVKFLSNFNTNLIFIVIAPIFNIEIKQIISKLTVEYRNITLLIYTGKQNILSTIEQFYELYNSEIIKQIYDFNKYALFNCDVVPRKMQLIYNLTPENANMISNKEKLKSLLNLINQSNIELLHPENLFANSSISTNQMSYLKELYKKSIDEYCTYIKNIDELYKNTEQKNIVLARDISSEIDADIIPLCLSNVLKLEILEGVWRICETPKDKKISYVIPDCVEDPALQSLGKAYAINALPSYNTDNIKKTILEYAN